MNKSYVSPKIAFRPNHDKGGGGLYAIAEIAAGERLSVWGGYIVSGQELAELALENPQHAVQVEEDLYLVPPIGAAHDDADYFNHSCAANAGFEGQITVVALRDIIIGEEVCIDYAMCDATPYDEFDCQCGAEVCRGYVTGDDWRDPVLQRRYDGYFMPYIQRRIDLHQSMPLATLRC